MTWCYRCSRRFVDDSAFNQHIRFSAAHAVCWTCNKDFADKESREQHYRTSSKHFWCHGGGPDCGLFVTREKLVEHGDLAHWFCSECLAIYPSECALDYHLGDNHHYCSGCKRFFMNENNLTMHLNSKLHRFSTVYCFGGSECDKFFVTISDAIHHIENGHCPSGISGASLRKFIIRNDRTNVITNPSRLLGYFDRDNEPKFVTERARNKDDCYDCDLCPKQFASLRALNSHNATAVHEAKVFRCPNHRAGCDKDFVTLGGVLQHIEDGHCGARDSAHVQDRLSGLMKDVLRLRVTTISNRLLRSSSFSDV